MQSGIYLVIICRSIDKNGIGIDPIICDNIAEVDYPNFKKAIERENWIIYCRSTLSSTITDRDLKPLNNKEIVEVYL